MDTSSETRFTVKGMKCGGCITRATEALAILPGYASAEFDLKGGKAVVKGSIDPQAAANALTRAGYPAEVNEG